MPRTALGDKRAAQAAIATLRARYPGESELLELVSRVVEVAAVAEEYEVALQAAVDRCGADIDALSELAASQGRAIEFGHGGIRLVEIA